MKKLPGTAQCLALFFAAVTVGCAGMAEAGGRLLDGSTFAEKVLARYRGPGKTEILETRGKDHGDGLVILLEEYPALTIRCSAPDGAGNFRFESLEYLGGSLSGWIEFTLVLSGSGVFIRDKVLFLSGPLETVDITEAKIRREENRLGGEEALALVRNRRDRILALTEWMRSRNAPAVFPSSKSFDDYWKPLLLPELVPPGKRPGNFQAGDRVRAEDLWWNTGYTALLFPEEIRPLRDSGSLLRDWEEAFEWIRFEYEWEDILRRLSGGIRVQRR